MDKSPAAKMIDELTRELAKALKGCGYDPDLLKNTIDFSKDKGFGDISCSVAFRIAKQKPGSPHDIAQNIVDKLEDNELIKQVTVDHGYINFYIERVKYTADTIEYACAIERGSPISDLGQKQKVIIEYPSVNPNKPWHLGHLKNAVLGDAVANIHDACSYDAEREDYIEDLGSQVVESVWGYLNLNKESGDKKFDQWLGEEYVKVNQRMQEQDMKDELSKLLQLMEQHGTYESKLAREISEKCVIAQNITAANYGIFRDVLIWETDIIAAKLLEQGFELLERAKVVEKPKDGEFSGCIIIDLSKIKDLPQEFKGLKELTKVLIRADGTPTYVAKDIVFHMWKFGMIKDPFSYKPFIEKQQNGKPLYTTASQGKRMNFGGVRDAINIIDVRQSYPQSLLKLVFNCMHKEEIAEGIMHLAYGELEMESGVSLSGRSGNWIGNTADDLLSETQKKTLTLISDKSKLSDSEKEAVSKSVALGAIKFDLLRLSPEKKTIFSWERALSFQGNSGPYCQYMYARAVRLLQDSGMTTKPNYDANEITTDYEFDLVKLISRMPGYIEKACAELRPNVAADYTINLAAEFSNFYEELPILKSIDEKHKQGRLALVLAFANTLRYSLALLGIPVVNRM